MGALWQTDSLHGSLSHAVLAQAVADERRIAPRESAFGDIWLLDERGREVVRGRLIDFSQTGMRLHLPVGYGVRSGRRYELASHREAEFGRPELGLAIRRHATVVRTNLVMDGHGDQLDVGLAFDGIGHA